MSISLSIYLCTTTICSLHSTPFTLNSNPEPWQGYLAHKKTPTPLGPPYDPRHMPTVGPQGGAFSCE